ncbi:hypothetical protein [Methylobacterium soli]|uniref:Uncharacterized protein n=1 Tax=Methylobacterium soli TaxID=553447 RepID=A0A6L3SYZ8_9HYPH|nr:hypothetical protein [Methylobacterium soli]KAB1075413.1 hypothetical protein F6X53_24920 [Methylobacterium soli]GJE41308.1 hypothetical protein AEGHOMDF_0470 [Methylobacterium soli]
MDQITFRFFQSAWNVLGVLGLLFALASVATYWAFKILSTKWLDARFNERLESYKHAQQRELEHLKFEINSLLDRTTKIHQLEFECLPEAWRQVTDAFFYGKELTLSFRSYADITKLVDAEAREVFARHEFSPGTINTILTSPDRQQAYVYATDLKQYNIANEIVNKFRIHLRKYGIFIRPEIRSGFEKLEIIIAEAMTERMISFQKLGKSDRWDRSERLHSEGDEAYKALEKAVQDRLWNSLGQPRG